MHNIIANFEKVLDIIKGFAEDRAVNSKISCK